jgi:hypothetical protein
MGRAGHVARKGEERKCTRLKDEIRMDLMDIGWGSVKWIQLAQDSYRWRDVVNTVMNIGVLAPRS